jgi:Flp pilus assembly protein TadG
MIGDKTSQSRLRGIALVETVIVTPVLLFLMLATAEITNAFVDHNTLTKSVRNGARFLAGKAILGTTGNIVLTSEKTLATRRLVVYGNASGSGSPILPGLSIGDVQVADLGNNDIEVTATYAYTGILGDTLPALGFGSDIDLGMTLQASVSMKGL